MSALPTGSAGEECRKSLYMLCEMLDNWACAMQVEKGAMIAAGAIVARNTTIPAGELWAGSPAKKLRDLKPEEASFLPESAQHYLQLAQEHSKETSKTLRQLLSQ